MSATHILMVKQALVRHADGVYTLGGQGNSLVVDLGETLLLVDAGPGGDITDTMITRLRDSIDKPVAYIVYSHGHMGYNNGVNKWLDAAARRGEPAPQIVGHANLPARYRRYRETAGLQSYTNTRQFRSPYPAEPPVHWFQMPGLTYKHRLALEGSARKAVLLHAPSETDDGTAVWIPESRVLYGSNAFIKACPNAGSPYRILRDPVRWIDTLERFSALSPDVLIPEFGKPLTDKAEIEEALGVPAQAMRYLHSEVVSRMNNGMVIDDIVHDVPLPDALFGNRFMKPGYGCAEFIMRDIWRAENGWWNRNPTDMHPARPDRVAAAIRRAIGDPQHVLDRARVLQEEGKLQLALHVIDLLADDPSDDAIAQQARELKAALCVAREKTVTSVVSRHLYLSSAEDLRGLTIGATDRARGEAGYDWN
ncbi:Metallo-beta-lactamase superfamily protein [Paraburkholderia sartisoli]|uniref:Metallo-beta-lactamase superfamily protein n=1 Tax=Paraburkholderia sartisoli TaxID=83784 RepID=A0A1H4DXI5_9BURK|nr:Metallo-beta-lactamase superfamily protein [Paraburkholderia sartisoli]